MSESENKSLDGSFNKVLGDLEIYFSRGVLVLKMLSVGSNGEAHTLLLELFSLRNLTGVQ